MVTYRMTGPGIDKDVHSTEELSAELWKYTTDNPDEVGIDGLLDREYGFIDIASDTYYASEILKNLDPTYYDEIRNETYDELIQVVLHDAGNGETTHIWNITVEVIEDDSYNKSHMDNRYSFKFDGEPDVNNRGYEESLRILVQYLRENISESEIMDMVPGSSDRAFDKYELEEFIADVLEIKADLMLKEAELHGKYSEYGVTVSQFFYTQGR